MPFLSIDRKAGESLTAQIYRGLRELVLSGALPPGTRLPSTRSLARELAVSRNVALAAFEQLVAEGYLEPKRGSGTFVAEGARFEPSPRPELREIQPSGFKPFRTDRIDLRSGLPDLARFPVATWRRLSRHVWERLTPVDLAYGQPEGRRELRTEIARYLGAHRLVRCDPEQVVVTAGTTQAVGIVSRLLLRGKRKTCLLEDPITCDIQRIMAGLGGRIVGIPVDGQGMDTSLLPPALQPALLYVTPSHQFPLGGTMPIQRRVQLLEYARQRGSFVVEDDYDSEFRYDSPPIASIQGLDPSRVIYIGTFSKTLFPGLRIGYIVLPPPLVSLGRQLKWFTDLHNASVDQLVLARFIRDGHYERHLHAMKKLYRARREAVVAALARRFGDAVEVIGSPAGLHLCARFRGVRFTHELVALLASKGVIVYPVEEHAIQRGRHEDTLVIGYGMLDEHRIEAGLAVIGRWIPQAAKDERSGSR